MAAEEANPSLQLPDSRRCPAEWSNHKHDSAQAPIQTRLSEKANTNRNPKFQKEHPISLFWVRVCLGPESRRNPQRLSQIRGCRMVQGASKGGRTARRSTNVPFSTQPHEGPRSPTKPHEAARSPTQVCTGTNNNKIAVGISVWPFSCCRAEICNLAESGLSPPVPGEKPAPEQLSCRITSDTMPHLALRRKTQKRKSYHVFPGAALQMDLPCPTALTTCHRHRRRPHGT